MEDKKSKTLAESRKLTNYVNSKFKETVLTTTYRSYPYRVPVNIKALQHTRIKELQVRMMRWVAWYKDEKVRNRTVDKDKWQHRFTCTLRCQRRAGKLTKQELEMLNRLWKIYDH